MGTKRRLQSPAWGRGGEPRAELEGARLLGGGKVPRDRRGSPPSRRVATARDAPCSIRTEADDVILEGENVLCVLNTLESKSSVLWPKFPIIKIK